LIFQSIAPKPAGEPHTMPSSALMSPLVTWPAYKTPASLPSPPMPSATCTT